MQAFVRKVPPLQRLTVWHVDGSSNDNLVLFRGLRDEIRSSGSDRRLSVGRNDVLYFTLDSSETCTDAVIEKFVKQMGEKREKKKSFFIGSFIW